MEEAEGCADVGGGGMGLDAEEEAFGGGHVAEVVGGGAAGGAVEDGVA